MAVSVVRDGEILYSAGHGVLEVGKRGKVDDRTLFQIGMSRAEVEPLLARLRTAMPNPEVAWWLVPVEGFGRLL
jgi:hypothetical protein